MRKEDIVQQLNRLQLAAKRRMQRAPTDVGWRSGGADVDFMTGREREERHRLIQLLATFHDVAAEAQAHIDPRIERRAFRKASNKFTWPDAALKTHFECFLTNMRNGIAPNIYAHQPKGCDFYRLYDGNRYFAGNFRNHACVASVATLEEALKIIDLSLRFPHIFAEMFL